MRAIKQFLLNGYDFVLDLFFPKYCVGCYQEGRWLCSECREKIVLIKSPTCPICNRLTDIGQICSRCRPKSNLTGVIVAAHYKDGPLKEAIHTMKYDGVYDLAKPLGSILVYAFQNRTPRGEFSLIPVPLHKCRKAERGFNQSELLAKIMSEKLGYQIINKKLLRVKHKDPQIALSGKIRRNNVKGIFSYRGEIGEMKNKNIILVDDVFTTGSTLEECARVLRQNTKVRQIWGLVLAKV